MRDRVLGRVAGGTHDAVVGSGARRGERGRDDRCDERGAQSGQSPPLFPSST